MNLQQLKYIVALNRFRNFARAAEACGKLSLAVGPTIASYILPKFIRYYRENYPSVDLSILELKKS